MPTLRTPVSRSFVITAGSVMNGAGSSGQQRWIGSRSRSTSSPVRTISWQARLRDLLRHRVGDRLELAERAHLVDEPLRRLQLEHSLELRARRRRGRSTPNARHIRRSVPNWLISSGMLGALDVLEQERRPAALDDAVDDLGDLEVGVDLGARCGRARPRARGARSTRAGRRRGGHRRVSLGRRVSGAAGMRHG